MSDLEPQDELTAVRGWLHHEGYPLEYEVARTFKGLGFDVLQGQHFPDEENGAPKVREIDVVADMASGQQGLVRLVVEAKYSRQPWLVLTTERDRPVSSQAIAEATRSSDLARRALLAWTNQQPKEQLPWHLYGIGSYGFNLVEVALSLPRAADRQRIRGADPYAALNVVVKAAKAGLESAAARFPLVVAFPVVVLDGPLYRLAYDEEGQEDLSPTEWERLVWSGALDGSPSIIDVVRRSYLERYAGRAERSARHLTNYLGQLHIDKDTYGQPVLR